MPRKRKPGLKTSENNTKRDGAKSPDGAKEIPTGHTDDITANPVPISPTGMGSLKKFPFPCGDDTSLGLVTLASKTQMACASTITMNTNSGPFQVGSNNKMFIGTCIIQTDCPYIHDANHCARTCKVCLEYHRNDHKDVARLPSIGAPQPTGRMLALPPPPVKDEKLNLTNQQWPEVGEGHLDEKTPPHRRNKRKKRNSNDLPDYVPNHGRMDLVPDNADVSSAPNIDHQIQAEKNILDCHGNVVLPGDGLWLGDSAQQRAAIFIGESDVIRCDAGLVCREAFDLTQFFRKINIQSPGSCQMFPPQERLTRALGCMDGTRKEEAGEWDFICYVYTGLSWTESSTRGLKLL